MNDIERQLAVHDLNARYVETIDEGRFEEWPGLFTDDGHYRVTTAENVEQGLPLSLIYATSRAMLQDRVRSLREANIYESQRYRHVVGVPLLESAQDGATRACTSFIIVRVMHSGESLVFATGCYRDLIVKDASDGALRFAERIVVLDSRQIDTLLALPL